MPNSGDWLASMPMYDFPEMHAASSHYWHALRESLLQRNIGTNKAHSLPQELHRPSRQSNRLPVSEQPDSLWMRDNLIFSQTCGYPYVTRLRDHVTLIGTPDYGLVDAQPGWYDSVIVVRADDERERLANFENARFVFNALDSQSGCHAMMHLLQCSFGKGRFFSACLESGAHAASIQSIARGHADVAAIDGVTWRFARRYLPASRELRELTRTAPTPGLPYISALRGCDEAFASAVENAIEQLTISDRSILGVQGFWRSRPSDYDLIRDRALAAAPVLSAHLPVINRLND